MPLKQYVSFPLLEEYLGYLSVIKGRSQNTIVEYRTDLLMFFSYMKDVKNISNQGKYDLAFVDAEFIKSITLNDMYAFISFCQQTKNASAGTRSRKIVSIRQFWKYLKTKAKIMENNVSEELETPKIPKRMPKHLTLEESVRLLIECEDNPRDHCIITMFLNCALRLSELVSIDVSQVNSESIKIIGKGNKERTIFLNPSTRKSISNWIEKRKTMNASSDALFLSKNNQRLSGRSVQAVVKKYLKKAGLDVKNLSTHKLRHTAATLMYQYGKVDIRALQQILGHESIATTQIYTHVSGEQLERAVNSNPLASMF